MGAPIRYGIIGTGMMGCEHARNLGMLPGAVVTAIADPHEASRAAVRAVVGADVALYADYRDLLAKAPTDALVIATPNHTHRAVLADVLATDKHVLVEKPLCTTVEDCRAVAAMAAGRRGIVWVGLEHRFIPVVARLIEEVRKGTVGRLRMLAIREHRFPFLHKVGDWNRFARNTGGTLVEECCHFFDLMCLVANARPLRVYASGAQDVNHLDETYDGERPDIIDNAFVIVDFDNGCRGVLDVCMFAEASREEEEVVATGDLGKVQCGIPTSTLIVGHRARGQVETQRIPVEARILAAGTHHGSTYYEHAAFLDAIRNGSQPAVTLEDGLMSVAMGAAAERSIAERRPVDLEEFGV